MSSHAYADCGEIGRDYLRNLIIRIMTIHDDNPYELNETDDAAMQLLCERGPQVVNSLVVALGARRFSFFTRLERMEKNGLVTITRGANKREGITIELTKKGHIVRQQRMNVK